MQGGKNKWKTHTTAIVIAVFWCKFIQSKHWPLGRAFGDGHDWNGTPAAADEAV
jgi:hypothetical protein